VKDPLYGEMKIPSKFFAYIDTPQFQRLRHIKQMGSLFYIYSTASHSRLEHSLGTCWLATKWLNHLKEHYKEDVDDIDIIRVQIAALCHDLGHGPFSNLFESLAKQENKNWKHERISCDILQEIYDQLGDDKKIINKN